MADRERGECTYEGEPTKSSIKMCLLNRDYTRDRQGYKIKYKIENKIEYYFGRFKCFCPNDIPRDQLIPEK